MSAFMRKNPRLASVLKADETTVSNKSATQFPPGLSASMSGASTLLASSGIPSLDICLGGGLPASSILTVFEDVPASKANFAWTGIVRCFLAETLATSANDLTRKDSGWIGIVGHEITGILDILPRPEAQPVVVNDTGDKHFIPDPALQNQSQNPDMKIAWRYQGLKEFDSNLKKVDSVLLLPGERTLGHTFDLGRKYDKLPAHLNDRTVILDLSADDSMESENNCSYKKTWKLFSESIRANQKFGLGRFVIGSLGAPGFWNCTCASNSSCGPHWLLHKISNLIQELELSHPCLVLVTIPITYLSNSMIFETAQSQVSNARVIKLPSWLPAVENVSDAVIELKPLASIVQKSISHKSSNNKNTNPLSRDYDGFLVIRKFLRRPTSFKPFLPETSNLAFKIKRRRFVIEKFHLPPSLEDANNNNTTSCSTSQF